MGGVAYRLGSYGAVVTPPNVEHFVLNGSTTGTSTFIEFQGVLRRDWFPPHPTYTAPKTPAPLAVTRDQRVFGDLDPSSDSWTVDANGARSKILSGQTIHVTLWNLSAANASVDLTRQNVRPEQFVYVLEGQAHGGGPHSP